MKVLTDKQIDDMVIAQYQHYCALTDQLLPRFFFHPNVSGIVNQLSMDDRAELYRQWVQFMTYITQAVASDAIKKYAKTLRLQVSREKGRTKK